MRGISTTIRGNGSFFLRAVATPSEQAYTALTAEALMRTDSPNISSTFFVPQLVKHHVIEELSTHIFNGYRNNGPQGLKEEVLKLRYILSEADDTTRNHITDSVVAHTVSKISSIHKLAKTDVVPIYPVKTNREGEESEVKPCPDEIISRAIASSQPEGFHGTAFVPMVLFPEFINQCNKRFGILGSEFKLDTNVVVTPETDWEKLKSSLAKHSDVLAKATPVEVDLRTNNCDLSQVAPYKERYFSPSNPGSFTNIVEREYNPDAERTM